MPDYLAHAVRLAEEVAGLDGVEVLPSPPQTSLFHMMLDVSAERFDDTVRRLATNDKVWTWGHTWEGSTESRQRVELTVGDATLALEPEEFREIISAFVG